MLRIGHEGRSCTGFRMPAVGELDACCWPASESVKERTRGRDCIRPFNCGLMSSFLLSHSAKR
jgi:hypothetical protein